MTATVPHIRRYGTLRLIVGWLKVEAILVLVGGFISLVVVAANRHLTQSSRFAIVVTGFFALLLLVMLIYGAAQLISVFLDCEGHLRTLVEGNLPPDEVALEELPNEEPAPELVPEDSLRADASPWEDPAPRA